MADLTFEEIRMAAIQAAATRYSGLSSLTAEGIWRDTIRLAQRYEAYIVNGEIPEAGDD